MLRSARLEASGTLHHVMGGVLKGQRSSGTKGTGQIFSSVCRTMSRRELKSVCMSVHVQPFLHSLARRIAKCGGCNGVRPLRCLTEVRRLFCQLSVEKIGHSGAEVARFPGITTSAVIWAAKTEELIEVQKYL